MVRLIAAGLLVLAATPAASAAALSARELDAVPMQLLPTDALARVMDNMPAETGRGPRVIAAQVPMNLGLDDGRWTEERDAAGEWAVWRLRLYSPGASLLIPSFDRFDLPEGAELHAASVSSGEVRGPYTRADRNRRGGLTLPFVPGDQTLLELRVPALIRDQVQLKIGSLSHGVHPLDASGFPQLKSGDCNIDVVCPEGNAWRDQIRSVVALQIPASLGRVKMCSGQLVNNTAQDGKAYVLTASHCGAAAFNADDIVAYFNFFTSSCGGTPNGSTRTSATGALFLDDHSLSDFSLVQLDRIPSGANAFYSGFNARPNEIPQSGVAIHHPSGEEKRISVFTQAPRRTRQALQGGQTVDSFEVRWSQGVTEPGSSGGGLWNEHRQLVGILSGGNANCSNLDGLDYFGRLDVAWVNGLRGFLDPANTGRLDFCGTNPGSQCNPGAPPSNGGDPVDAENGGGGGGMTGLPILFAVWLSAAVLNWLRRRSGRHR